MYKVLASDIDNTLTASAREVAPETYAAVRRAVDAGIKVVLSTGRGYKGALHICRALDLHGPVINYGGARVNDIDTGEALLSEAVPPELILELLELARELNVHAQIYQGDGIVYERENALADKYASYLAINRVIDPDIRKKQWANVPKVLYIMEPERVIMLEPMLVKRFEGRLEVCLSNPAYIEFTEAGIGKGSALKWLAEEYWGIKREDIAAIGDNTLDNSMLAYAGLAAVVENGAAATLALADIITPSCAENGVGWLIDNVLLKAKGSE